MSLSCLPVELISHILVFALFQHPVPSVILRVSKQFFYICEPILYSNLHFTSTRKLSQFAQQRATRPPIGASSSPRTLTVTLAGGVADFYTFEHLRDVLRCCTAWTDSRRYQQLPLDVLSLCLNSHLGNPKLGLIYDALTLANPRDFTWSGPDPSHHFSIAIVPAATMHLLRAASHWTNLQNLKLTNIAFPSDDQGVYGPLSNNSPLLSAAPTLRTVYLGQVTLLPPSAIAAMVLLPDTKELQHVKLVDAYRESIWGLRIRRRDVEHAALAIAAFFLSRNHRSMWGSALDPEDVVARVRDIVSCEAKTERIVGGDRVEQGVTILE